MSRYVKLYQVKTGNIWLGQVISC